MGAEAIGLLHSAVTGLVATPTYSAVECNNTNTLEERAGDPKNAGYRIGLVRAIATAIAGGATSITWYLSEDAAGLKGITNPVSSTIQKHAAADTAGWIAQSLSDVPWMETKQWATRGKLWFHGYTNAGTVSVEVGITWTQLRAG